MLLPQIADCFSTPLLCEEETRYRWLFRCLEMGIRKGTLEAGLKLPSSRVLAEELNIARNTVKTAYEMLLAEGYIESRVGDGSYVVEIPEGLLNIEQKRQKSCSGLPLSRYAQQYVSLPPLNSDDRYKLQPGIPALNEFPLGQWKRCLSFASSYLSLETMPPAGDLHLREQIVSHLHKLRGLNVSAEQILITSGSQQATYLVAQLLLNPGDHVAVETPGFPGTSGVFKSLGCHVDAIDLARVDQIESEAKLINLTPSRNFPLGHTLSLSQRLKVMQWAEERNRWVLEDDYDSEFAQGHPISSLHAICDSDRVIYMGTFSRSMFPALRLGYMVLPSQLVSIFIRARRYMDGGLSQVAQKAMAEFMRQGFYARHLKKMRKRYAQREALIRKLIAETVLTKLNVLSAPGGMHLVLGLPETISDQDLVAELGLKGYGIRALSGYTQIGERLNGLVIGFCADSERDIASGLAALSDSLNRLTSGTNFS